jgi:hypothetical protein
LPDACGLLGPRFSTRRRYPVGLAEHFSQKQVAEIAATVINMNLWTRLKLAQGAIPVAE